MIKQALILAGGIGRRLGRLTDNYPKPMMNVSGRPFLEYIIWNLKRHGIENIILSVGYIAERIIDHFGDGRHYGVLIDYVIEKEPAGTGGALKLAAPKLDPLFLVVNGDTILDINYLDLALFQMESDRPACVALQETGDASMCGTVSLEGAKIKGFYEKDMAGPGLVSSGIYILKKNVVDRLPEGVSSIEFDLFPLLAEKGKLYGKVYNGFFLDIGLPETFALAQKKIPAWQQKPAAFFDRDGVLNKELGYVCTPQKFQWSDGAHEAVKLFNDSGWIVIVVTNQSGIGRGYYTERQFIDFSLWINESLRKEGAHIDATYFCPHHPESGTGLYRRKYQCRKPATGLIDKALADWPIDFGKSILIGDKDSDIQAADAAGIKSLLFTGGNIYHFIKEKIFSPEHCTASAI